MADVRRRDKLFGWVRRNAAMLLRVRPIRWLRRLRIRGAMVIAALVHWKGRASASFFATTARVRTAVASVRVWTQSGWLIASVAGSLGIVLTVLLFLSGLRSTTALQVHAGVIDEPIPSSAQVESPTVPVPLIQPLPEPEPMPLPIPDPAPAATLDPEPVATLDPEPAVVPVAELDWAVELARPTLPADPFGEPDVFQVDATTEGTATLRPEHLLPLIDQWDNDDWNAFIGAAAAEVEPVSYLQRIEATGLPMTASEPASGEPAAAGTSADVKVSIERIAPERAVRRQMFDYRLVVRNEGADPLERVDITEAVPNLREIIDVVPAASIVEESLSWQLRDLQPGEERILTIQYRPEDAGTVESTATVVASARVSSETLVESVPLQCVLHAPQRVLVGEEFFVTVEVTNPAAVAVEDVVIETDVPAKLQHARSRALENRLGTLEPGETRTARLRVQADQPGPVTMEFVVRSGTGQPVTAAAELEIIPQPLPTIHLWSQAAPCFPCLCR